METTQNTPRDLFRILKIMYTAILIGNIFYIAYSYISVKQLGQTFISNKMIIQYLWFASLLITMVMIPAAYFLYKKKIENAPIKMTLVEKLIFYRAPFFIKLAILEACCFINATFYLITGNIYILGATAIVLIVLVINFPGKSAVSNDLKLNFEESERL
ncbi:MAG: hypothetical protein V1904_09125 [Bacteroidota bacterium]